MNDRWFLLPVASSEAAPLREDAWSEARLWASVRPMLVGLIAERLVFAWVHGIGAGPTILTATLLVIAGALWCLRSQEPRMGFVFTALAVGLLLVGRFPAAGNHVYLQATVLVVLASAAWSIREERLELLALLRWLSVVVFVYAGVQKIVHGFYSNAEFFTYMIAHDSRFDALLSPLLSQTDQLRVEQLVVEDGGGPFRVESPIVVLGGYLVCAAEIGLAALLLWPRSRKLALLASLAMVAGIEVVARELFFGLLMVNLLVLWHDDAPPRWLEAALYVVCALVTFLRLGLGAGAGVY